MNAAEPSRRLYVHITDPTAVNWDGDLPSLDYDDLLARHNVVAQWIARQVSLGADPWRQGECRAPVPELYRATRDEITRRPG